jgi:steroid delta-isomerase-like uncharacterized protein
MRGSDMSNQKNKEILIKFIDEVWNKGNLEVVDELVAPQYVIRHDPGDPWETKTIDLATFKQRVIYSRNVFPDLQFRIEDLICEDGRAVISWFMIGTHKGDIAGFPATNKPINVSGLTIYYFSAGKITGHWQVFDRLTLFQQLGIQKGRP